MRPLNRPMFRYGGPIKEGIMSGIKEPRQGYRRGKIVSSILNKIPGGQAIISGTKDIIPRTINRVKNFYKTPSSTSKDLVIYNAADAAKRNPAFLTNRYLFEKGIKPVAGGIYKTGKTIVPYTGVGSIAAGGGAAIYNMLKGDPKIDDDGISQINKTKAAIGMPENLTIRKDPETAQIIADKINQDVQKSAEELRKDRVQRYRDIMDIKGMNKNAAYNSLIAASQLINQEGDFKGSLKDGSLISKIIGATSKAFDKPAQTKDAIDTLILKGEIEKDIKASDPSNAQLNALRVLQGKKLKKELNPSFNTLKASFAKDNKGQSGIDLAAGAYAANNGIDFKGNIISKSEFNDILKDLKTKTKGLDEDLIIKNYTEEIIRTQEAPDGAYTVGDKIVIIQDKQVIAVE